MNLQLDTSDAANLIETHLFVSLSDLRNFGSLPLSDFGIPELIVFDGYEAQLMG